MLYINLACVYDAWVRAREVWDKTEEASGPRTEEDGGTSAGRENPLIATFAVRSWALCFWMAKAKRKAWCWSSPAERKAVLALRRSKAFAKPHMAQWGPSSARRDRGSCPKPVCSCETTTDFVRTVLPESCQWGGICSKKRFNVKGRENL